MTLSTALTKVQESFMPMIEKQLTSNKIQMDPYAKQCVMAAISSINAMFAVEGINWNDPRLDKSNLTQTFFKVAALKLNAEATQREVYFQIRNYKIKDSNGKEIWKKKIEMGIEGDGNDALLANFGRDVKKVGQFWEVREGDHFEYPIHTGFDVTPPVWRPTGKGQVVRVVYPIMKTDGTIEYHIGEREDVAKNLIAHINNVLMNETFGICKDRNKATEVDKKKISEKKAEILKKAQELGLDALDDEGLCQWISPAWKNYQSRESMIIRKMRNNAIKKIPKDFGSKAVEILYEQTTDETYRAVRQEVAENANGMVIDIEPSTPAEPVELIESQAEQEQAQEPEQKPDVVEFEEEGGSDPAAQPGF